jgi:hypothetical protein
MKTNFSVALQYIHTCGYALIHTIPGVPFKPYLYVVYMRSIHNTGFHWVA